MQETVGAVKASKFVELDAINDITRTRIFTLSESGVNLILYDCYRVLNFILLHDVEILCCMFDIKFQPES